jgi:hypothetical protein
MATVWLLAWWLVGDRINAATLKAQGPDIGKAIATLTLAMISIMGGAVAFAAATKDSYWIRRFKSTGLMDHFLILYGITLVSLFVTHILSIYIMIDAVSFRILMASCVTNILQVLLVMANAHNIASHSESS